MKRMPKHELPVIPTANLVDIAILLIIFYMACSNFISQQARSMTLPKARDLEKLNEPLVLVTIDKEGAVTVQGQPVGGAADVEGIVTELLRDKTNETARQVMFRCDAGIDRSAFEPVLNAIVNGGGTVVAVGEKIKTE